jgi:2-hydroxychromene-2-carboxylate isomerase
MSKPRLSFFYDFVSPYTYFSATQIDALAAKHDVEVSWEPALLGGIMKATGNTPPAALPARASYMMQDLVRWAEFYGVPFTFTPFFPLVTMAAMRAALGVRMRAKDGFAAFNQAVFRAAWVEQRNVASKDVLADIAKTIGIAPEIVLAADDAPNIKDLLKEQTQRAVSLGAFGMPYVVVEQGDSREGYFGNDRLPLVEARLVRGSPWPTSDKVATIAG